MFDKPVQCARRNRLAGLAIAVILSGLAGCVSAERRLATEKEECATQGVSPSTSAFEDCIAEANSRRRDAEARQSVRMRELQEQSMENFLHSQSAAP